jgi:hypothetical protein
MSITWKLLLAIGASAHTRQRRQIDRPRGPEPGAAHVLLWRNSVIAGWKNYELRDRTPLKWGNYMIADTDSLLISARARPGNARLPSPVDGRDDLSTRPHAMSSSAPLPATTLARVF